MLPTISANRVMPTQRRAVSHSVRSATVAQPLFRGNTNSIIFPFEALRWAGFGKYLNELKVAYPDVDIVFSERKILFVWSVYKVRMSSDSVKALYEVTRQVKSDLERYSEEKITAFDEALAELRKRF